MKKRICVGLLIIINGSMMSSTNNPKEKSSEMAKLMKQMLVFIQQERQQIEFNQPALQFPADINKIRKAKITKGKKLSENHEQYVVRFFEDLNNYYQTKDSVERKVTFNVMINSCVTCHQHECPGPITVIKKSLFEIKE